MKINLPLLRSREKIFQIPHEIARHLKFLKKSNYFKEIVLHFAKIKQQCELIGEICLPARPDFPRGKINLTKSFVFPMFFFGMRWQS